MSPAAEVPTFLSRREARAAREAAEQAAVEQAAEQQDAAQPAAAQPAPAEPEYGGVASLFPLLAEASASPLETTSLETAAELGATQAIPAAEVAAELATAVPAYVVPQSAPVAVIPVPVPVSTVPPTPLTVPSHDWDVADVFGLTVSDEDAEAPTATKQRRRKAAKRIQKQRVASHNPNRGSDRNASTRASDRNVARRAQDRKSLRQRIFGVGVMVLVGGLFAVLALPAYADNDASALGASAKVQTQKLAITAAAADAASTSTRDTYTATSAADLKALYANAIRQQNVAAYLQSGAKSAGDDYPWFAELSRNQGGGLSPLNYYYRECVDFVAWRLNRDAGSTHAPFKWVWSNLTPSGGNASQWKSAWLNHGWATGTTPVVGAVAWFPYNHVAYVSGILNSGQVLVEEYNWQGQHMYGTRVINAGDAYYLYAPS